MRKSTQNYITIPEDPGKGPSLLGIIIMLCIFPPVGILMIFIRGKKEWRRKRYRDFRRYASIIGGRSAVSIRDLAMRMGKDTWEVISDLQSMIDQGFIGGGAYVDRSSMMLVLDQNVVETEFVSPTINVYVTPETQSAPPQPKPVEAERAAAAPEQSGQEPRKARPQKVAKPLSDADEFEEKLRQIRQLNDEIEDGPVSDRIDRIGELTASIFRVVQEKPDRAEEVRKFMNYYLPTTFKLLKSYSLMEKQSYQGENIQASRKKIEDILDTLIHAFEQQQDRLFRAEALDVEADISVLETMMASDGLIEPEGGMRLRAGGKSS